MSTPYFGASETQTPPQPFFIGLDLSLASTGVATIHGDQITVRRIKTKPVGPTTGEQSARLHRIVNEIMAFVPLSDHTFVAVEGPAFGANDRGAHVRGGLWWMVRNALDLEGMDTVIVPPTTVKKYATGKGNANKDAVLAAIIRRYPDVDVTGNDEADALALASIRARYNGLPIDDLPQVNVSAMTGVGR